MLLTACFHDYFCASRLETMKIYLACREDMMVLFHLLTACCFNLHAAHTRDVLHNCCRMHTTFLQRRSLWNNIFPFTRYFSITTFWWWWLCVFVCQELESQFIWSRNRVPGSLFLCMQSITPSLMRSNWWAPSRGTQSLMCDSLDYLGCFKVKFLLFYASFCSLCEVSLTSHRIPQLSANYPHPRTEHACEYCIDTCSMEWKPRPHSLTVVTWDKEKIPPPLMCSSPPRWTRAPTHGAFDLEARSRSSNSHFLMDEIIDGSLHLF